MFYSESSDEELYTQRVYKLMNKPIGLQSRNSIIDYTVDKNEQQRNWQQENLGLEYYAKFFNSEVVSLNKIKLQPNFGKVNQINHVETEVLPSLEDEQFKHKIGLQNYLKLHQIKKSSKPEHQKSKFLFEDNDTDDEAINYLLLNSFHKNTSDPLIISGHKSMSQLQEPQQLSQKECLKQNKSELKLKDGQNSDNSSSKKREYCTNSNTPHFSNAQVVELKIHLRTNSQPELIESIYQQTTTNKSNFIDNDLSHSNSDYFTNNLEDPQFQQNSNKFNIYNNQRENRYQILTPISHQQQDAKKQLKSINQSFNYYAQNDCQRVEDLSLLVQGMNQNDQSLQNGQQQCNISSNPLLTDPNNNCNNSHIRIQTEIEAENNQEQAQQDSEETKSVEAQILEDNLIYEYNQSKFFIINEFQVPSYDEHLVQNDILNIFERRQFSALSQYKLSYQYFSGLLNQQFDNNLSYLSEKLTLDGVTSKSLIELYTNSYDQYISLLLDTDLKAGLIETFDVPHNFPLTNQQALDMEIELEEYIEFMYGDHGERFTGLNMTEEQLKRLLRCLAEDMIFEKYKLEVEQVYKFLHEQTTKNRLSSQSFNKINFYRNRQSKEHKENASDDYANLNIEQVSEQILSQEEDLQKERLHTIIETDEDKNVTFISQ
eukprot:403353565